MSVTTINLEMDTEQMRKIFGMQDAYIKKLEQDFQVTIVDRNGSIIITGEEENAGKASRVLRQLTALSDRGNEIEEQSVDYAIEMGKEDQEDRIMEMDADCICHTINGKPIKPKTLGQKAYVDAIRKNMIVFGLGPAGTGKTYLALFIRIDTITSTVRNRERHIIFSPFLKTLPLHFCHDVDQHLQGIRRQHFGIIHRDQITVHPHFGRNTYRKMHITCSGFFGSSEYFFDCRHIFSSFLISSVYICYPLSS